MLAKIFGVCVALLIIFVWIPSFTIGLVIWWNFVHYIFFEPSRNECGGQRWKHLAKLRNFGWCSRRRSPWYSICS